MKTKVNKFLNKNESVSIEEFSQKLKKSLSSDLLKIELFGSKARGHFNKDSDVDILIVVRKKTFSLKDKLFRILLDIDLEYDSRISPLILSQKEYEENKILRSPLILAIEKEGIKI
ncbi:MAG: nucleotidyltransferase domain-containing protein [Candidatus Omnitrophica bacterium]|nr:nucleotidyltransferase domain-containing protein [Candidatus Omnitrophota bacterium]